MSAMYTSSSPTTLGRTAGLHCHPHILNANCSIVSILLSEGFLQPATMARSVYTAVAYAHSRCRVPVENVLLYTQVARLSAVLLARIMQPCVPTSPAVYGRHGGSSCPSPAPSGASFVSPALLTCCHHTSRSGHTLASALSATAPLIHSPRPCANMQVHH
jgi:hypothetical protein